MRGPLVLVFLSGMLMIVSFFLNVDPFPQMELWALRWYYIVLGFALLLGVDSLILHNLRRIRRGGLQAFYSATLVFGFFVTLAWGVVAWIQHGSPFAPNSSFLWLFRYVEVPLDATMFSLLAFFIASAAYRAFRARNFEATLLLVSAGLVMMGRVPLGGYLAVPLFSAFFLMLSYDLFQRRSLDPEVRLGERLAALFFLLLAVVILLPAVFPRLAGSIGPLAGWIVSVPQVAGKRGVELGLALGSIAFGYRVLFGMERGYLR